MFDLFPNDFVVPVMKYPHPGGVSLRVAVKKCSNFLKKNAGATPRLVSFRGQKMCEPYPDWSPLGVSFKIPDEHPHLFIFESPLPPPPGSTPTPWKVIRYSKGQRLVLKT